MKKTFPLILLMIFGVFGILPSFLPHPAVQGIDNFVLNDLMRIVSAFALVLGLGSLLRIHFEKIRRRAANWPYSWVLVITFFISSIIGLFGGVSGHGILPTHIGNFPFDIQTIYLRMEVPLGGTMFALLAFFMASASYRAFRARSTEATLLLATAFVVMIGILPLGDRISHRLPAFAQWIMDLPLVVGQRGIGFGIALGGLATELKIILGIERSWLGGAE
jgi:uncharacterized membrane protein YfcA